MERVHNSNTQAIEDIEDIINTSLVTSFLYYFFVSKIFEMAIIYKFQRVSVPGSTLQEQYFFKCLFGI